MKANATKPDLVRAKQSSKRQRKQRRANDIILRECVQQAEVLGIELPVNPPEINTAMTTVFQRAYALFLMAGAQVDQLTEGKTGEEGFWETWFDPQGNLRIEPSRWIQREDALRKEVFEMATAMGHLNIDERMARVDEAKLAILARALQAAARRANLTEEQRRMLGSALRDEIAQLEQGEVVDGTARAA